MLGILFPGQGSQAPGMGQFLYENFQAAKECFEEASDVLSLDMKKLCFEGSAEDLALTENTQPALLLVSTALHRTLSALVELKPQGYAGHSVGEYAALVAAGGMSFSQSILAVRKRGQAMQSAVPIGEGAMLAVVGPTAQEVAAACKWAEDESGHGPVSPANYNSPQQTVVSGAKPGVDWLHENIKGFEFASQPKRLMTIPLKVSAPFHCEMMRPAEDEMEAVLGATEFQSVEIPVVQNLVAKPVKEADSLRKNLVKQVTGSVRWAESIEVFRQMGCTHFVEAGTGKVLAGLNKKIDKDLTTWNINSLDELKTVEQELASLSQ